MSVNINYNDFKDICRMCMLNCNVKFYEDCVVSDIFLRLTDLHFETNDDLPKHICLNCFEKINEIREFIFQCKRTHNILMECLNNHKQVKLREEEDVTANPKKKRKRDFAINLGNPITVEEEISSTNINNTEINQYIKLDEGRIPETSEIKEEVIENTNLQDTSSNLTEEMTIEEHKIEFVNSEHVFDETSKVSNEQNILESDDNLFKSNTANIKFENIEIPNLNDLNEDIHSVNCSNTLDPSSELNENEDKLYKCLVCDKTFNNFILFEQHKCLPDCERPFECDQCSKSFPLLKTLKTHMRTHSGERPFKCDQCSKLFAEAGNFRRHMLLHSGERPFKCDLCSKSFTQSANMKKHMLTHSGERPFKCDQCPKSFIQSSHLHTHLRTHSGDRSFKCDQCYKSFKLLISLKNHKRNQHRTRAK